MRKVILCAVLFVVPALAGAQTYGPDVLTGGSTNAETYYNASFVPDYVVDNNTATRWASTNNGLPEWWLYDLATSSNFKSVDKVRIYGFSDVDGGTPAGFVLSGSTDYSTWIGLTTSTVTAWNTWEEFTFDNPNTYRYYKIDINTDTRASDDIATMWEVEMMECTDCAAASSTFTTSTMISAPGPNIAGLVLLAMGVNIIGFLWLIFS